MSSIQSIRSQVTALLERASEGPETFEGPPDGPGAVDRLVPLLYEELRAMARRQLRRSDRNHTLQTTGLVHEAYLKLAPGNVAGRGRAYFFAAAARAMRQVLVERARARKARKRGGNPELVTLHEQDASVDSYAVELVEVDDALRRLARHSPRQATVIEYRFFGGMTVQETAEALGVSTRTVEADWAMGRAWLFQALRGGRQTD